MDTEFALQDGDFRKITKLVMDTRRHRARARASAPSSTAGSAAGFVRSGWPISPNTAGCSKAPTARPNATMLINAITTNQTSFFREPHHFDFLDQDDSARHSPRHAATGPAGCRIWSAGCSTGEEPYTIAMTLCAAISRSLARLGRQDPGDRSRHQRGRPRRGRRLRRRARRIDPGRVPQALHHRCGRTDTPSMNDELRSLIIVQAAQPARTLADAGTVRRDLLPQRRDLFRQADAARGCSTATPTC